MERMLTPQQLHKLEVTERVASCFSLIGTSFILFTFLYSPVFRKPVNRLIFYASWGNTLCNVATLMSQSPVRAGRDSPLCQFQGFLIQMFLPADALWNLAMAINVYMKLFRKYSSHQLKALEWKYHIMCYGGPFLVAFVYIFVQTAAHGRIYGPAILWCWIDIDWVVLRIALCYAPAWCCIIISFFIYLLAGREIFIKRQQLRAFSQSRSPVAPIENPFTGYKTTEIHITSELATLHSPEPDMSKFFLGSQDTTQKPTASRSSSIKGYDQYSVTIDSAPLSPRMEMAGVTHGITPGVPTLQQRKNKIAMEANTAAWGYTKVALLFFISLLVTWVPSSINRVYSLIYPELVSLPFTYASGIVLPLMGFWNSVIYITTSWHAVCLLFSGKLPGNDGKRPSLVISRPSMGSKRRTGSECDGAKVLAVRQGSGYNQV